jgi:DNA ligase-1
MYRLFKKDSKGKIRFLGIDTEGSAVIQISGLLGGKQVRHVGQCEGKNIGRSNETTPEYQATLEANAKFVKKLKEGYFTTQQEAVDQVVILPMLAKVFEKEERKVTYPCYAQPKLDGMRGLGDCNLSTLTSRSGNNIETLGHITSQLPYLGVVLDGELYAHGETFQENMRMIKKYRPGKTENVKYHVYDVVMDNPFKDRLNVVQDLCSKHSDVLEYVPTTVVESKKELIELHAYNISQGYEGTIVRHGDDGYKLNGRSSSLLKLKDFEDMSLTLLDVIPSEKRPTHGKPIFSWEGAENNRLGAGISLSHAEAEDLLANKAKHIGKTCELRFFEYSDTGVPRHPVMYGFRLDK